MKYKSITPRITYDDLLRVSDQPLSVITIERLARLLRNTFGARPITRLQFEAVLHRHHIAAKYADECYELERRKPPRTCRSLSAEVKRAIRYRIAEGYSPDDITRDLNLTEKSIHKVTVGLRTILADIKPRSNITETKFPPRLYHRRKT